MTERQLIALLYYQMNDGIHLTFLSYEQGGRLEIQFLDSGRNFHHHSIGPNGTVQHIQGLTKEIKSDSL